MLVAVAVVFAAALASVVLLGQRTGEGPAPVDVPAAAQLPSDPGATSDATRIPRRALDAYVGAARRIGIDDPTCRLAWNTLAGIGASESSHGAYGGARLDAQGRAAPLIIGVP
ncbi:MAG: hypothetical protein JWP31_2482, partial [Aeromicrobium sp.]|nr:hypothetical protein [Aeromicrobium sp.]